MKCDAAQENTQVVWRKVNGQLDQYARPYYNKLFLYYVNPKNDGEYACYDQVNRELGRFRVRVVSKTPVSPTPAPEGMVFFIFILKSLSKQYAKLHHYYF